jgi:hypothetical protein
MKTLAMLLGLLAWLQQAESAEMTEARTKLRAQDYTGAAELLEAVTVSEPNNGAAWYLYGYSLHALGDHAGAVEIHVKAAAFPKVKLNASYNAACAYAALGKTDEAFEWLGKAAAAGFSNPQRLQTDADLASLRRDARFKAFLPIGAAASFVEKLDVLHTLVGEAPGDRFGWIGRNAGDTDGDGVADLLLSAPFKALGGPAAGRIYVYSGKTGELRFQRDGQPGYQLGIGIERAGDVDGDGVPDQLAGAVGAYGTGAAFVFSGVDGGTLLELRGEGAGDNFGRKVAGAGDQDGDGVDDVIIGAPNHDGAGADAGRAYVFSGVTGEPLITLDGASPGDNFGRAVDAYSDGELRLLIVGAPNEGPGNRGRVHVYRVEQGQAREAFVIESQPGDVNLGYMFVSAIGDVNGDGTVDVYASDWNSNANGVQAAGRIYVHSGVDGERLHDLAGETAGDGFGIGTAEAGDVDGDGCDDLLVGAWQQDAGAQGGGRCYLYSGKTGALLQTYTCATPGETFGFDTTTLGDVDGDGGPDFLITAADSFAGGPQSGRSFVIRGPAPGN